MESKEFIELLDFLIELSGGEEIDLDYDPYEPGRVIVKVKKEDGCENQTDQRP